MAETMGPDTVRERELREDAQRFRVVSVIAAIIAAPFMVSAAFVGTTIGTFQQMYEDMGGTMPWLTRLLVTLGRYWVLPLFLVAVEIAIFYLFYRLAKRYWIGLLFVPPLAYLALNALLLPLLYLPVFSAIELVK